MKFKMAERSLFAVLLRSPWWISFVIAAGFGLVSRALLPSEYFVFGALGGFPFVIIGVIAGWRQLRAPSTAHVEKTLALVDTLSWRDFSAAVERAFVQEGYAVQRLDGPGAEFSLTKSGHTTLLACKRWKAARLGIETVEALYAARVARDADAALCITTGEVSEKARQFAAQHGISLLQGTALALRIRAGLAADASET